jgi:hypothetical protein
MKNNPLLDPYFVARLFSGRLKWESRRPRYYWVLAPRHGLEAGTYELIEEKTLW